MRSSILSLQDFADLCREIVPQRAVSCVLRDLGSRLKKIVEWIGKEFKPIHVEIAGIRPDNYFLEPAFHI